MNTARIKEKLNKITLKGVVDKLMPLFALAIVLLIWLVIAVIIDAEIIVPAPAATFARFFELLSTSEFWTALGSTLYRTLIGFAISFVLALVLAITAYAVPILGKLISPVITVVRATPTMSVILLALIWLSSTTSPMLIAGLIAFPMLFAGFYGGLTEISTELINMAKLYKVPFFRRVFKLYVPEALPSIFTTSGGVISLTLKVVISGEVLAQTVGSVGLNMQLARIYLDTATLLAWTVAAIVLGYLLELAVSLIKRLVVRW